ncbi:ADR300Cp [Eremothecium gossypii ATCC 10895]|uniref:non-specific serine/threonine protein kinase n=1 Tax=Eremothecium gossypii (strain ATCC 10895 / CBS 109.51 / FGSC 9923 / NRRL Y-1056) TaxID=284811 RepID=Q759H7_EREGS|nr:ADR300Cp [Eremothecium gossypii ATCC 10895]AAS52221.1 ADR300Cp [Eremothecium gossypii ATCC 10895]AEY96520.1 FADR300Cp [Eremothecium gossypii FDAG1]
MTLDYEIYKEGGLLKDRYHKLEDISEGSYGYVSLAKDTKLKKLVAVKYIFKSDEDDVKRRDRDDGAEASNNSSLEKRQMLLRRQRSLISEKVRSRLSNHICFEALYEVDIQSKIGKHKNITELYDYFDSYIIMEYCSGGDLYEAIKADTIPRKTRQLTHIISQILDAVEFVHSKGIYHRDIKPENILIADSNWTVKLTDWGLATTDQTSMDRNVGSERYMAPELFESNLDYDERNEPYECSKVDIWAIGIVLLNIVFHKNPFSVANQTDKSFCYFAANREALFDVFSTMSYDLYQLLRHSLTIDPTNRYLRGMREELSHLNEYTLDDEYYNSLHDEGETVSEEEDTYSNVSRFQEVDSTATTNTPLSEIVPSVSANVCVVPAITVEQITPAPSKKEAKDPIPRFTFTKRSHPKSSVSERNTKPIKIKHNRKIIKNTRKPLGIPTPNSHINNFFQEYNDNNDSDNFNTRDFFTPPGINNGYMDGVFNKRTRNRRYSNYYHSNDYNGFNCRPNSASAAKSSFHSAGSSGNNNSGNYYRRGSSVSCQNSPSNAKYVPPHSRNSFNNSSPNNINNQPITTLESPKTSITYHEQQRLALDAEPDLDDVLFTLEETDVDNNFLNDMANLAVHQHNDQRPRSSLQVEGFNALPSPHNQHPSSAGNTDVPELLKSAHSPSELQNHLRNYNISNGFTATRKTSTSSDYKPKPGIYIPPHHRKSFNQGSFNGMNGSVYGMGPTLSVNGETHATPPYSKKNGAGVRKNSNVQCNNNNNSTLATHNVAVNTSTATKNVSEAAADNDIDERRNFEPLNKIRKPYMPHNHASSTTAIQSAAVFADTNAVVFEEDSDPLPLKAKVLHVHSPHKIKSGRKSSIQDDLVGSLEQYKNNWLILQQHQE